VRPTALECARCAANTEPTRRPSTAATKTFRGLQAARPDLYAAADYSASQVFGEGIRRTGDGIVYDSLRHVGGVNVVAYWPRKIRNVTQRDHYELTVPIADRIVVRRLAA
jgi:hypothetical protein